MSIHARADQDPQLADAPYLPALDGLRGMAILLVMLYHFFDYCAVFKYGWAGVDLFFVLSGFLITRSLLHARDRPHLFLRFYAKRILRIFPLYYLALVFFLLLLPAFFNRTGSSYYHEHQAWFWLFGENWLFTFRPPSVNSAYLVHFWSLALEEQYYLIWPAVLIFGMPGGRLLKILPAIVLLVFLARVILLLRTNNYASLFFPLTCTRPEGLLAGSALAIAHASYVPAMRSRLWRLLGLNLLLCTIVLLIRQFAKTDIPFFAFGGYLLLALIGAILIEYFGNCPKHALFTNRWLIHLGKISFGLYIVHWPIYVFLSAPFDNLLATLTHSTASHIAIRIAGSCCCLLLAAVIANLSYFGYEIFFLRLKKHLPF